MQKELQLITRQDFSDLTCELNSDIETIIKPHQNFQPYCMHNMSFLLNLVNAKHCQRVRDDPFYRDNPFYNQSTPPPPEGGNPGDGQTVYCTFPFMFQSKY